MIAEFLTHLRFFILRKKRSELDDEMRFHLEQSIAAKVAAGFPARGTQTSNGRVWRH